MKPRRLSREAALQALYQCDTLDDWSEASVDLYFEVYHRSKDSACNNLDFASLEFAMSLSVGAIINRAQIDTEIERASKNWSISRMCRVDRNILRVAVFEMLFVTEIPLVVSINEAIEIAKHFATNESHIFINGVLDKVRENLHGRGARKRVENE